MKNLKLKGFVAAMIVACFAITTVNAQSKMSADTSKMSKMKMKDDKMKASKMKPAGKMKASKMKMKKDSTSKM